MKRIVTIAALLTAVLGCNKVKTSGESQNDALLTERENVDKLNALAKKKINTVKVHFDKVDEGSLLSLISQTSTTSACVAGAKCDLPSPITLEQAVISGEGGLSGDAPNQDMILPLHLEVTFDAKLSGAAACLKKAYKALRNGLQLDIEGTAQLLPIYFDSSPGSSPGSSGAPAGEPIANANSTTVNASAFGMLVSQARAIDQGLMDPPTFYKPSVGVVLRSIENCREGAATVPAPTPPAAPPGQVCPALAMLCPDGSAAKQAPNSCAFLPCEARR